MTAEAWRIATAHGNRYGAVVSDTPSSNSRLGDGEVEAYGGYLVAESIAPEHRPLVAAAPALLRSLGWALPLLDLIDPSALASRGIDAEEFDARYEAARAALAEANGEPEVVAS